MHERNLPVYMSVLIAGQILCLATRSILALHNASLSTTRVCRCLVRTL